MLRFYTMTKTEKTIFHAIGKISFDKMMFIKSLISLTLFISLLHFNTKGQGISFATSLQEVYNNSNILQISKQKSEVANSVKKGINSAWLPSVNVLGGYTWMSNDINVSQQYKSLLTPFDEYFDKNVISQGIGSLIYNFFLL